MNASPKLPPVAEVLPQKPPMLLLESILWHTPNATACRVDLEASRPFSRAADGAIPSWVALEYMAQCAAAHSGMREHSEGRPIRMGFLLGSRRVTFHARSFAFDRELHVVARSTWSDTELASFECQVNDPSSGALLAECELAAYSPHRLQDLLEKQST
jgi:predicted hotdog family 3-hydroxylacyl-ACP dehydratase